MSETLYLLALLACPVGMGAMMWVMNRNMQQPSGSVADSTTATAEEKNELVRVRAEIDQLRAERADARSGSKPADWAL